MGDNSHLHTKDDLCNILRVITYKEFNNTALRRALNDEYSKKGLTIEKVGSLFDGVLQFKDMNNAELIVFAQVCYDILKEKNLSNSELEQFFSKAEIQECKNMTADDNTKDEVTQLVFDNIRKIDGSNYVGRISYEQIYKYIGNGLLRYNTKSQREPILQKIGTKGEYVREIDLNREHVKDIANLMLSHEFEENQIILNVLLKEKNNPDCKFIPRDNADDVIGTLVITPHTADMESIDYTIVDILDGFHRIKGAVTAVGVHLAQHGTYLDGGLDVRVVFRTLEDARKIVRQTFKRSDTNENYLAGMDVNDYTKMVDKIGQNSKVLKDKIGLDFNDCIVDNALTYKGILANTLQEFSELDVNSVRITEIGTKEIAKSIDNIILYISETYFDNDIEKMKRESHLLDVNIFVGYLSIACEVYKQNISDIFAVAEKIYSIPQDRLKPLNLNSKKCNIQLIHDTFIDIATEENIK